MNNYYQNKPSVADERNVPRHYFLKHNYSSKGRERANGKKALFLFGILKDIYTQMLRLIKFIYVEHAFYNNSTRCIIWLN